MKYKDIKEEFRKKYGFIGNWEEMQYWLEMCPDTSFLFENIIIDFSKALDSNTKRVKKEVRGILFLGDYNIDKEVLEEIAEDIETIT